MRLRSGVKTLSQKRPQTGRSTLPALLSFHKDASPTYLLSFRKLLELMHAPTSQRQQPSELAKVHLPTCKAFCLKSPYILSGAGGGAINFHETVKFGICSTLSWIAPLKREKHVGAIALIGNGIILMLHNFICTYPADQNTRSICISCD
jgi:hypothetical protein